MNSKLSERNFEATIEESLLAHGYQKRAHTAYDRTRCLIPADVFDFVMGTQPEMWARYVDQLGEQAESSFLQRLQRQVERKGTVALLRNGLRDRGCRFHMAYFVPETGLNPAYQQKVEGNRFAVVRQLRYSAHAEKSLDVVLFLNGLPLFTAELKEPLKGQTIEDAERQYRYDRDPRGEPLFAFGRVLAHFAVDPDLASFTTKLDGRRTRFFPFNQGDGTGAGNPPNPLGFATSYLWDEIWAPDSLLNLVRHFVHTFDEADDEGRKERKLIFPRYHQIDAVRRLIAHARAQGAGQRYLVQHSAGSGKSFSIAWLAHQLAGLHDAADRRIFHSVVVVTDRRVLDEQIQETVHQFEQTVGLVAAIDQHSQQLREALESGKQIIVSTLQKFPFIVEEIGKLSGSRFAVIVDEAHSSQSGEMSKSLKQVLAAGTLEEAEAAEAGVDDMDMEDRIAAEMRVRGPLPNVSFFAFTATPKARTLELFGSRQPDGSYEPFSLYAMRQAIEEGFILDVLQNYTTYKTYFHLLKTAAGDPRVDKTKTQAQLKRLAGLHAHAIRTKVEIMVEHFVRHTMNQIDGRAKAMIVTRSRKHCVRYKLAVDKYLQEQGYGFRALVAFSGTVRDEGAEFTETSMNGFPQSQTAATFKKQDLYRLMIVANKFQTGFDVPLLHTMYVDKKLGGVNAVQTLSRLNRTHPHKDGAMVLDFANEAEHIEAAFKPYYEKTFIAQGTDPNYLYDLQEEILNFRLFDMGEVRAFAGVYYDPDLSDAKRQAAVHHALAAAVERYEAATQDVQADFRGKLKDYVRRYAFLAQVIAFVDVELEMFYEVARHLFRKLRVAREEKVDIRHLVDMDSYGVQKTSRGTIRLPRGGGELDPTLKEPKPGYKAAEQETLSQIVRDMNERFWGGNMNEEGLETVIVHVEKELAGNEALARSVESNPPEKARLSFEQFLRKVVQDMVYDHANFYKKYADDEAFKAHFVEALYQRYLANQQSPAP